MAKATSQMSFEECVEKLKCSQTDSGMYNGAAALENSREVPQKIKHGVVTICSNNYAPRYIFKKSENIYLYKAYIYIHILVPNSQKTEIIRTSIN